MPPKREPILDGIPSPSLARMRRMRPAALRHHLQQLEVESERIDQRLQRLAEQDRDEATRPAREARLERATAQRQRLARLIEVGYRLLDEAAR